MIDELIIFGATGDLSRRYLLPGLAALHARGHLPDALGFTGAGREDWDDQRFRAWVAEQLDRYASSMPADSRHAITSRSSYHRVDVSDPAEVKSAVIGNGAVAAYLALPPAAAPAAVSALHAAGLPEGSSIVLEKPFGEDLASAEALNRKLDDLLPVEAIFRVDHFLAMTTVQNVLGSRLATRVLESIWNSSHISEIEIIWDETVALEGRAGYYDGVGALKDMVQNHLLQLLCLVAMEPPVSSSERDLRDRKLDVLRSVRIPGEQEVVRHTRRARYSAGSIGDRAVPAYADEPGVDPQLQTETFAEAVLELESWRWSGTTFRLRTGKALSRDRAEVAVHFRPVPHLPFTGVGDPAPNVLRFGHDPEAVTLELTGGGPGPAFGLRPLTLDARLDPPALPAYGRVLLDFLDGDATLSIRGDEAEESWRIIEPIMGAWSRDLVPLELYPAGSEGPVR